MPIRIVIDEVKFRELVAGRTSHWTGSHQVEIVLEDIGWRRMIDIIIDALTTPHRPPDPPQAREFLTPRRRGERK